MKTEWMQTWYKSEKFYPLEPIMDTIYMEDIVHCLSNICRYSGHCNNFYSVAEHCTIMASIFPKHAKIALLHDAAEAYFNDLPRPIKSMMPEFKHYEHELLAMIFEKFNVGPLDRQALAEIEIMDQYMLYLEKHSKLVMDSKGPEWGCIKSYSGPVDSRVIKCLDPRSARINFQMAIENIFDIKVDIEI